MKSNRQYFVLAGSIVVAVATMYFVIQASAQSPKRPAAVNATNALSAPSTAPSLIPFQGQLTDQQGNPVTPEQPLTLVFRIYKTPTGGVPAWEEAQQNVEVVAGRFTVLLGTLNEFEDLSLFNSTVYLGITPDDGNPATADVELRPRQAIVPIIAAVHSVTSEHAKLADVARACPSIIGEVPIGGILPYFGTEASLPANFMICAGQSVSDPTSPLNGQQIPDLQSMFVRGAGSDFPPNRTGGRDSIPDHSHYFSDSDNAVWIPRKSLNGWIGGRKQVKSAPSDVQFDDEKAAIVKMWDGENGSETHGHMDGVANISGQTSSGGGA